MINKKIIDEYPNLAEALLSNYQNNNLFGSRLILNPGDKFCFECHKCGNCCKSTPNLFPADLIKLSDRKGDLTPYLRMVMIKGENPYTQGPWLQLRHEGEYCVFYDSESGCTIHDYKPLNCLMLPVKVFNADKNGCSITINLHNDCPGLFKGPEIDFLSVVKNNLDRLIEATEFTKLMECTLKEWESNGLMRQEDGFIYLKNLAELITTLYPQYK